MAEGGSRRAGEYDAAPDLPGPGRGRILLVGRKPRVGLDLRTGRRSANASDASIGGAESGGVRQHGPTNGRNAPRPTRMSPPSSRRKPPLVPPPSLRPAVPPQGRLMPRSSRHPPPHPPRAACSAIAKKIRRCVRWAQTHLPSRQGAEGTVYEVRLAGLANDEAQALCAKLTSAGASCRVGSPMRTSDGSTHIQ